MIKIYDKCSNQLIRMDFHIRKNQFIVPTIMSVCWHLGFAGLYAILLIIVGLIIEFNFQILVITLNLFALGIFLKRLKFSIHIKLDYVPRQIGE